MTRRLMAGLMVGALVAFPLACGDDDDGGLGGSASTEAEASDPAPADTAADDTAADATSPGDTTSDDTAADDTATDDTEADGEEPTGGDLARWCEITNELNESTDFEEDDPAALEAAYDEVEALADEYIEVSPDQIREDAETVVASLHTLRELLESHDWNADEVAADPAFAEVFTPEAEEAGTRLDEFEDANCTD